ncbi:PAS domain S-box protein [bacterium]|nr:PAS domain S-box protein [bacterium]MBP9807163.1 PAS domain S-box protein [bacterium]
MRSLNLSHKAFVLILVPLFFEVLFLTATNISLAQLDKAYELENQTRGVLQMVNLQTRIYPDAAAALGLAAANRDISQLNKMHRSLAKLKKDRALLLSRDDLDTSILRQFNASVEKIVAALEEGEVFAKRADQSGFMRCLVKLQVLIGECNDEGDRVSAIQIKKALEQRAEQERLRGDVQAFSSAAVLVSIFISILLVVIFNRSIANRLKIISKNAIDFANDKPIAPVLKGNDEIAQLDRIFHDMAFHMNDLRRREKALTENASEIICSIDPYFEFESVNKAITTILGYLPEEVIEKPLASICSDDPQKIRAIFKEIAERKESKENKDNRPFLLTMKTKVGELREIMWSAVFDKEEKSYFCVAHDVTEINKTARLKRELTAMATHDLRAPLASLQLTLDLFCKNTYGELTERGKHRATQSAATIGRLVQLINSFLEIDKLESGTIELNLSEEMVSDLIRRASVAMQGKAEAKALTFQMADSNLAVECDGSRIVDVFQNLLDNAIKYSPERGVIKVLAEQEKNMVRISIMDQGPGVPEEQAAVIFEKFKQGNVNAATEKQGTGLGLAICKAIVQAHGGDIGVTNIGVTNAPDWGGIFWITLPTSKSQS